MPKKRPLPTPQPQPVKGNGCLSLGSTRSGWQTWGLALLLALRTTCPAAVVIVLISHLDARQQAALSAGADRFISKDVTPDRVAKRLQAAAAAIRGGNK